MTDDGLLADLEARGLVQECTDPSGLRARLTQGSTAVYYGCDPTADSLHVGNLIGLLALRRFQAAGHRPIALAGGATGMVGDPGGRSEERNLLDEETLAANVAAIRAQIARIVDLSGGAYGGLLVDNRDWTVDVRLLDFLRDIGKHVSVNTMLGRDSVKNRLASAHGISFTEFSYMLLQANDFLHLHQDHGCQVQIGGSDQWGNMVGGVDLIRRVGHGSAWAVAWPLLTASDGTKLGKTTGARIWLDPARTSPYAFFQHWMQIGDRQVGAFLAQFTFLTMDEIRGVVADHKAAAGRRTAQALLARQVTGIVHGADQAEAAEAASAVLFGAPVTEATPAALAAVAGEVPMAHWTAERLREGVALVDVVADPGLDLAASKGEARRALTQGGVYVNGQRVGVDDLVTEADLVHGRYLLIRRGKRAYALIDVQPV